MRTPISKRLRFAVLKRDRFRCLYCGRGASEVPLHVDHWNPVLLGGSNDPSNLVTACRDCNLGKSATPVDVTFDLTMLVVNSRFSHTEDYDPDRASAAIQYCHDADGTPWNVIHGAALSAPDYEEFEVLAAQAGYQYKRRKRVVQ